MDVPNLENFVAVLVDSFVPGPDKFIYVFIFRKFQIQGIPLSIIKKKKNYFIGFYQLVD